MGWLLKWASSAPGIDWWRPGRPLRLATDCTGLAIPELAARMLAGTNRKVQDVFVCDVWSGSRRWLQLLSKLQPEHQLSDMNMRVWNPKTGNITTRNTVGDAVVINKDIADLDIYICGFMCTPFTPNGDRKGWADENAKTFWSSLKTISTLRPRTFVLENVKGISNNGNFEIVENALKTLTFYIVVSVKLNSIDYGVPQHRPRIYIVGLRKDCVPKRLLEASQTVLEKLVQTRLAKHACPDKCEAFPAWLTQLGHPIHKNMQSEQSEQSQESSEDHECTCDVKQTCDLHVCNCLQCRKFGAHKKKCLWRRTMLRHLKSAKVVIKKRAYLKQWREVKKNPQLKNAPTYFTLAKRHGLNTTFIKKPCQICLLKVLSQTQNILHPNAVLNLGKTLGRNQFRKDGLVPTLGHGCTTMFLPGYSNFLKMPQMLCLTGLHPKSNAEEFKAAQSMTAKDMDLLMGNAMCLPVVGHVMAVALSLVTP